MSASLSSMSTAATTMSSPTPSSSVVSELSTAAATLPAQPFLLNLVIGLGVSTGVFMMITIFLLVLLVLVICCQKRKNVNKQQNNVFEGSDNSHWINTLSIEPEAHQVELPIWSVQTFSTSTSNSCSSPLSPPNQNMTTVNLSPESTKPTDKIMPKRVAPPPPKSMKKNYAKTHTPEKQESSVYAVPVCQWYRRKKKLQPSTYTDLDLSKMDDRNMYSIPKTD